MKYIRIIIVLLCVFVSIPALGQKEADQDGGGLRQIAVEFGSSNWLVFKQNARYSGETLFSEAKEAFGLSSDDGMRMVSVVTDGMGCRHYRYQQTYKGVDVEGAVYCVHEYGGRAVSANGRIVTGMDGSEIPRVQRATVFDEAIMDMGDSTLNMEGIRLVYTLGQDTLTHIPENYVLAYEVSAGNKVSYYDAETGDLFKSHSNVYYNNDCLDGTANTLYNGNQSITTKKRYGLWYILVDRCRGGGIQSLFDGRSLLSNDNIWDDDMEQVLTASAHWATEMTFDYYLEKHGRVSFDGSGSPLTAYIGFSGNQNNACWSNSRITCGKGNGVDTGSFVSLDVIGHEFTHGVVESTSELGNTGETGALNESFSDIFGTMVEFYVEGEDGDYLIAEDVIPSHGGLRNMGNPNQKDQPDTYQGDMWYTGDDESIKVHTNCGVQNYWFYLLAEGGEGVNDNNDAYEVQGIGREKAAMIAYYNMVYYMNSSCDYADARNGAIMSAAELFGVHSIEFQSTIAAWDAVGVNNAGDLYYDIETDCETLRGMHNDQELPVSVYAIHGIESDCQYVNNQVPVQYCAGEYVLLTDGFCSGDNFTAYIFPDMIGGISDRGVPEPAYCAGRGVDGENATVDDGVEVGAEEVSLTIYPNPSTDYVNIVSSASIDNVVLYDITGRQLRRVDCPKDGTRRGTIDIGSLALGVYMMEVRLSDGSIVVKRLIKR